MATLPIMLGLSALGGVLSNRPKKTTQTTTQTDSPEMATFRDQLLKLHQQRLGSSADLSGYKAGGLQTINNTFGQAQTGLNAELTARGLSDSPAAVAPIANMAGARSGSMSQFLNSLPMLQRQLQGEDLQSASGFYGMQPRTTTTTGTGSGNMLGGGINSAADMLAFLYGSGMFGGKKTM